MYRLRRYITLTRIVGSVPLLLLLALAWGKDTDSPLRVADALDQIIQPRFQDMTAGVFGTSRVVVAPPQAIFGHPAMGFLGDFRANKPSEASLLARADGAKRAYVIAFLHCAPVPGEPQQQTSQRTGRGMSTLFISGAPHRYPAGYREKIEPALSKAALALLPIAVKGKDAQAETGDWAVVLRPVRASQDSCLTCHTGAKHNDTLGVMVYAVSKTISKEETAPS